MATCLKLLVYRHSYLYSVPNRTMRFEPYRQKLIYERSVVEQCIAQAVDQQRQKFGALY